jgi:hypothetical protein
MRLIIGTLPAAGLIAVSAGAVSADKPEAKCNWGQATAAFVAGSGNNLGDHWSDQENPRAGSPTSSSRATCTRPVKS